jgi:hypothetical protein
MMGKWTAARRKVQVKRRLSRIVFRPSKESLLQRALPEEDHAAKMKKYVEYGVGGTSINEETPVGALICDVHQPPGSNGVEIPPGP